VLLNVASDGVNNSSALGDTHHCHRQAQSVRNFTATLKEHEGHVPMNVGNIWRGEAGDRR
jgi:hypothetical protein